MFCGGGSTVLFCSGRRRKSSSVENGDAVMLDILRPMVLLECDVVWRFVNRVQS